MTRTRSLGECDPNVEKAAVKCGESDGQPGNGVAGPEQGHRRRRLEAQTEKHGRDRQALNDGLELACHAGPEGLPLAFQVAA